MSLSQKERTRDPNTGLKISAAKKGRSNGHEGFRGFKHSEDTRIKMSTAKKGKGWSEARRQAQINKNNGL